MLSGRRDDIRRQGVTIIVEKHFYNSVISYKQISERIISVTFCTNSGIVVFQMYVSESSYDEVEIERCYDIHSKMLTPLKIK